MNKTFTKFKSRLLAAVALAIFSAMPAFAQNNFILGPTANATSNNYRAPNGIVDFHRASMIYLGSEFPGLTAGPINTVGFSIVTPAATAAVGNIKIYMANTTATTYTRGTTWATILTTPTPMVLVYDGPFTIPATAGPFNVTLQTPFAYTGGNFNFAFEWTATTKSAIGAVYDANNSIAASLVTDYGTALPTTLTMSSGFRPVLQLGVPAPANDLKVEEIFTQGKISIAGGAPHTVKAVIKNQGSTTATNKTVTLTISGVNAGTKTATIATLAPGASTEVTFSPYTPTTVGQNFLEVTLPADDNLTNNLGDETQFVTANKESYAFSTSATADPTPATVNAGPVGTTAATNGGARLSKFTAVNRVRINSVRTYIAHNNGPTNPNFNTIGRTVKAIVVDAAGNVIGQSAPMILTAADVDKFIDIPLTTPAVVQNADYYVGLDLTVSSTATAYSLVFTAQTQTVDRTGSVYNMPSPGATPVAPAASTGKLILLMEANLTNITGVKEELNAKIVSVYPNPSNGVFNVSAKDMKGSNLSLEVRDLQGKLVYSANAAKESATIDLKNVASGIYMLQVSTDSEIAIKRLVVE